MSIGREQIPSEFVYARLTAVYAGDVFPEENLTSEQIGNVRNGHYCTYTFRNNTPTPTKSGVSQLDSVTLLVNLFSDINDDYTRFKIRAGEVRDALDGYKQADPIGETDGVQSISFENIETGYGDDFEPEGFYYAQLTFNIRIAKV